MKLRLLSLLIFVSVYLNGQTIEAYYDADNYKGLVSFADKTDSLSGFQTYCIGYAYFQLGEDMKAVDMFDISIAKGETESYIYRFKGLAYRYDKQYDKAIENYKIAVEKNAEDYRNTLGLAYSYKRKGDYDSALESFYNTSALNFDTDTSGYIETLSNIANIELTEKKNYDKAIKAYKDIMVFHPTFYKVYPPLIDVYYTQGKYDEGDRYFDLLKEHYEAGKLKGDFAKFGNVLMHEFKWKNKSVMVFKNFKAPEETLDIMYKIYVLNEAEDSIEHTFMTEKTMKLTDDSPKHLLCGKGNDGSHRTYGFGWKTDDIDFPSLKKYVLNILEEGITPLASSNFAKASKEKGNKDDKKTKKKKKQKKSKKKRKVKEGK